MTAPGDVIGRLNADRFVITRPAPAVSCETVAQQLVDAIRLALRAPIPTPEIAITVRVKCGIALAPQDAGTPEDLLDVSRARVSLPPTGKATR